MIAALDNIVAHAERVADLRDVAEGIARAYGDILVSQWPTSRAFERPLMRRILAQGAEDWVPVLGGPWAERCKRLVGWRLTRRLQRLLWALGTARA